MLKLKAKSPRTVLNHIFKGAVTCYPVGILSDFYCGGRRKPFVYLACILLSLSCILLYHCTTLGQMVRGCALWGAANGKKKYDLPPSVNE